MHHASTFRQAVLDHPRVVNVGRSRCNVENGAKHASLAAPPVGQVFPNSTQDNPCQRCTTGFKPLVGATGCTKGSVPAGLCASGERCHDAAPRLDTPADRLPVLFSVFTMTTSLSMPTSPTECGLSSQPHRCGDRA